MWTQRKFSFLNLYLFYGEEVGWLKKKMIEKRREGSSLKLQKRQISPAITKKGVLDWECRMT